MPTPWAIVEVPETTVRSARSRLPPRRRAPKATVAADSPSMDGDCRQSARCGIRHTRLRRFLATYRSRNPDTMHLHAIGWRGSRLPTGLAFPANCYRPRIGLRESSDRSTSWCKASWLTVSSTELPPSALCRDSPESVAAASSSQIPPKERDDPSYSAPAWPGWYFHIAPNIQDLPHRRRDAPNRALRWDLTVPGTGPRVSDTSVHLWGSVGRSLARHNMTTMAADLHTMPTRQNHVPHLIIIKMS